MPINIKRLQMHKKSPTVSQHSHSSDKQNGDDLSLCWETRGAKQCDVSGLESLHWLSAMPGFAMRQPELFAHD